MWKLKVPTHLAVIAPTPTWPPAQDLLQLSLDAMAVGFTKKELARRRSAVQQRLLPRLVRELVEMRARYNNAVRFLLEEIQDRRKAEEALSNLRQSLRVLLDGEPDVEPAVETDGAET